MSSMMQYILLKMLLHDKKRVSIKEACEVLHVSED